MATVARINVTPVKGLGLLHPEEVELTERGVDWLSLEGPRGRRDYDGMQLVVNGRVLEEHVDYHG